MIRFTLAPVPRKKAAHFTVWLANWNDFHSFLRSRNHSVERGTVATFIPDIGPMHLGDLVFWDTALAEGGPSIAVHEIMHATLMWARRKKILPKLAESQQVYDGFLSRRSPEERICHAMSAMTQQFVREGYRRGIWT